MTGLAHRLIGGTFLLICLSAEAFAPQSGPAVPPGVEVRTEAAPQKVTVGDPVRITFDVTLPPGYEVRLPKLDTQEGEFSILNVLPGPNLPDSALPPNLRASSASGSPQKAALPHFRAQVVAAVYKTGEVTFPSLQLTLRDPVGKETALPAPPVKIVIESVLSAQDQKLDDLKKQADIPEPSRWLLWLALGLLTLLLLGLGLWLYRRRSRPADSPHAGVQLDPLQLAEAELRDLLGRGLLEKRMFKQFYVALSEIVKKILEAGYGVPAIEKTTDEILQALSDKQSPHVPTEDVDAVGSFLAACDLVKFAKCIPTQVESEVTVKDAYRLLSLCRNRRAAVTAPAEAKVGGGT